MLKITPGFKKTETRARVVDVTSHSISVGILSGTMNVDHVCGLTLLACLVMQMLILFVSYVLFKCCPQYQHVANRSKQLKQSLVFFLLPNCLDLYLLSCVR